MNRLYYRLDEVSQLYPVKVRTLRSWIYTGKIKASKVGRHWMVAKSELERVIAVNEYKAFRIRPYRV